MKAGPSPLRARPASVLARWLALSVPLFWAYCGLFMPLQAAQAGAARCVDDDFYTRVCLAGDSKGAARVVSLAPHLTEIVDFLGAAHTLQAVDQFSDYPESVKALPKVGDSQRLDMERVLALKPDLVLAWASGTSQVQINHLRKLGIPVYVNESLGLQAVARSMQRISVLLGREADQQARIQQWLDGFKRLNSGSSPEPAVRVFYQVWHEPLMTLNSQHVVSEIIRLCGGRTAYGETRVLAPTVSMESVLQFNPDLILISGKPEGLQMWSKWPRLSAVQTGQLRAISPNILVRNGPRLLQAADEVCRHIRETRLKLAARPQQGGTP